MTPASRILVVDDEPPARARLRRLLEELPACDVVGEAAHGREALQLTERLRPDVVLLDIRMPDMDGIETARHLAGLDASPAVIFTTAYDGYAIEAFDAQAVGYLLKPVRRERLVRALEHARRLSGPQLLALAAGPDRSRARTTLCARKASGLQLIPVGDVRFFQADQKYVTVNHLQGEDLIEDPLKDLEDEFGERFIRIHRSVLVAVEYLERMERRPGGHYEVRVRGCADPLPVSRRHVAHVKQALRRGL